MGLLPPAEEESAEEATPEPSLVGTTVGDTYIVKRLVTAGGMGQLYEAEHKRLGQRLALKVIHDAHAHRPESIKRFEREAKATAKIRSAHVLSALDFLQLPDGRPCIITEFLDGRDLSAHIEAEGRVDLHEALNITRQLCKALAAAHAHGVVHRDLKPSNVFLTEDEDGETHVWILDFGVAKLEDRENLTLTGAIVGTPAYMSPEQAMGLGTVDQRSDIYAVGAVLYHMVAGQPPYGNIDATKTLMGLLKGEPPRATTVVPDLPEAVEALIERSMAREPDLRPESASALRRLVVNLTEGEPSPERAPTIAPPEVKFARLTASLLVLLGGAAVGVWLAATLGSLIFTFSDVSGFRELERYLFFSAPIIVGVATSALLLKELVARWRSQPRVLALSSTISWGVVAGSATLGLMALAFSATRAFHLVDEPLIAHEHMVSLLCAAVAALTAALLVRRKVNRPSS